MINDKDIEMNQELEELHMWPHIIEVGTNVRWLSAAGTLEGTVKKIKLGPNGNGDMIPWMIIEGPNFGIRKPRKTRLAATKSNLSMMKLRVI